MSSTTIFALSSGRGPAGVAVVRVSGPAVRAVLRAVTGRVPPPRRAVLLPFRDAAGAVIDRGMVLFLEGPASFTGEDTAEFHGHGGRATVKALIDRLAALPGLVPAEAGAFTRRAFETGRMDLTAVEGLADLVAAETEAQRRQALRLADGAFGRAAERWRAALLEARALVEADLDFAEEEDVPGSAADAGLVAAAAVRAEMAALLSDGRRGERLRDGYQVVVLGPPNAGKSSLVNHLARRDVAIVAPVPGTTRDVLEVFLDLDGLPVTLVDTAGLRDSADVVEAEGVRRARGRADAADLVLWLSPVGEAPPVDLPAGVPVIRIRSRADAVDSAPIDSDAEEIRLSVRTGDGVDRLLAVIATRLGSDAGAGTEEPALIAHARQRSCLEEAVAALLDAEHAESPLEVRADALRRALDALGRLVGRVDVEEVLGAIFSSFCIGK